MASTLATFSSSSLQKTDFYSPSIVLENMGWYIVSKKKGKRNMSAMESNACPDFYNIIPWLHYFLLIILISSITVSQRIKRHFLILFCLSNLIENITHTKVLLRHRNCMCISVILHLDLRGLGRIIYNQCNIHLGINQVKHTHTELNIT